MNYPPSSVIKHGQSIIDESSFKTESGSSQPLLLGCSGESHAIPQRCQGIVKDKFRDQYIYARDGPGADWQYWLGQNNPIWFFTKIIQRWIVICIMHQSTKHMIFMVIVGGSHPNWYSVYSVFLACPINLYDRLLAVLCNSLDYHRSPYIIMFVA